LAPGDKEGQKGWKPAEVRIQATRVVQTCFPMASTCLWRL